MAGMMGSKDLYKNSPKLERGENGKMGVSKKETPAPQSGSDEADAGEAGMPVEKNDMQGRHNLDRHMMFAKHEHEHATSKADKTEMHARHHTEIKAMMKKHEDEMGPGSEDGGRKDAMAKGDEV